MKILIVDRISNDIINSIHAGNLKPGDKLASYSELAKKYNTSIVTVRKSISSLVTQGYLTTVERVGAFVKEWKADTFLVSFTPRTALNEEITRYSVEGINLTLMRMKDEKTDEKGVEIRQIFYSDAIPLSYQVITLLLNGKFNIRKMITNVEKNMVTIFKILDGFDVKKTLEITLERPGQYMLDKLLLDESDPVFCFTTYFYTLKDVPIGKSVIYAAAENVELYGKKMLT